MTDMVLQRPHTPDLLMNRDVQVGQLTLAETDTDAVGVWLAKYEDTPATWDTYHRESERFLMWVTWLGLTLRDVMVEHVLAYKKFLHDPLPRRTWCVVQEPRWLDDGKPNPAWKSPQRPKRLVNKLNEDKTPVLMETGDPVLVHNLEWKPFLGGLSETAAKQASTILFGMFEFLAAVNYTRGNPFRAAQRKKSGSTSASTAIERYIEPAAWDAALDYLETLPRVSTRDQQTYYRNRFVLSFAYFTGFRRAELANAKTSDLRFRRGKCWLHVIGKGNKKAKIAVQDELITAIKDYRTSLGRPPLPEPDAPEEPLIMDITGKGRHLLPQTLGDLIGDLLTAAGKWLQESRPDLATQLLEATTHFVRHTTASHMIEAGVDLLSVKSALRHCQLSTTEKYLHRNEDKHHIEMQKLKLRKG